MMRVAYGWVAIAAVTAVSGVSANGLGTGLWHEYTVYDPLPTRLEEAVAAGWTRDARYGGSCQPGLGIQFSKAVDGSGPSRHAPMSLFYTPSGQIAGIATLAFGALKGRVVDHGYWKPQPINSTVGEDVWSVSVTFRSAEHVCSSELSNLTLGDRAVINADTGLARAIPLDIQDGARQGFQKGSCFASMGTHQFFDLETGGAMTWEKGNLMNVVPMYDRNNNFKLNAIFFTFPVVQQQILHTNGWEPVPLPNGVMCKNLCDSSCGWHDTHFWSTMHIYFSDPHKVTCLDGCKIGCCEA